MAVTDDTAFWPKLLGLSQCLATELAAAGLPDLCFLGIVPGEVVIADYCSGNCTNRCGMGWVRLVAVNEMPSGLQDVTGYSPCGAELEAQVEVGVMRCAPMLSKDTLPTVEDQLNAARIQYADMAAMLKAIRCCFASNKDVKISTYQPIGPDGDCIGGRWLAAIAEHGG